MVHNVILINDIFRVLLVMKFWYIFMQAHPNNGRQQKRLYKNFEHGK